MNSIEYIYYYHSLDTVNLSPEQKHVNNILYEFKEGFCDEEIKHDILQRLNSIFKKDIPDSSLTICFVPTPKLELTVSRYTELASFINQNFRNCAYLNTLSLSLDYDEFLDEKRRIICRFPERVKGKTVVFIDFMYNTGDSYSEVVDLLNLSGASNTVGLYLAKVVRK